MKIIISNQSKVPIYEQIKEAIIERIVSGTLKENDQLPSIRSLARDLKVSVITTTRAYKDLEEAGYVTNVQGKGCYVLAIDAGLSEEMIMQEIEEHITQIIELKEKYKISQDRIQESYEILSKEMSQDEPYDRDKLK